MEELGYRMKETDRFKLYLTNTLDMEDLASTEIPGLESLSEESHSANIIKKTEPILVILGNPPYSGISLNKSEEKKTFKIGDSYVKDYRWDNGINSIVPIYANVKKTKKHEDRVEITQKTFIGELLQEYYFLDGKPLGEKKVWLNDDYVKFLRFSQWKIHKAGQGIVGMITNHSYLDNPTFRGMRQSLMNTFNEIYIIDLHGNSLKKETAPDGSIDENVFDIRQGTAIALMVKKKNVKGCKIVHRDMFGERELKYNWLGDQPFKKKDYEPLKPTSPWYFFIKRDTEAIEHYNEWPKVNDLFPVNNVGIVTARDHFAIDFNIKQLEARIRQFRDLKFDDYFIREAYSLKDTSTFKMNQFRKALAEEKDWSEMFQEITYRPFDNRFIFYSKWVIERPITDLMQHMLKANIGIILPRQFKEEAGAFITENIIGHKTVSAYDINSLFPLYLYNINEGRRKTQTMMLFEPEVAYDSKGRTPNISKDIIEKLEKAYKKKFQSSELTPEHILHYCYGILYSNTYREKYAEFLRIDFPRIPFTTDYKLFLKVAAVGEELTQLHLLKHKALNKPIAKYKGKGDDRVEKPKYDAERKVVFINSKNYFEGIPSEIWNYHIGGYQVMEKYLKDRKGRLMDDPGHYCKIATALNETISLQTALDKLFPGVEKSVID